MSQNPPKNVVEVASHDLCGWRETPPDTLGWWVAWDRYSMTLLDIEDDNEGNLVAFIDGRNKRVESIGWAVRWMPVPIPAAFKIDLQNAKGMARELSAQEPESP